MWGLVESYTNLTPRGLCTPVTSSEDFINLNKNSFDSFLMPRRSDNKNDDNNFEYMIFAWNGKQANPLTKVYKFFNFNFK